MNLIVEGRIPSSRLAEVMNISKVCFIPTIKDGNPRIIGQCLKCGVFCICSSILEGGKGQLNGKLVLPWVTKYLSLQKFNWSGILSAITVVLHLRIIRFRLLMNKKIKATTLITFL